MGTTPAWGQFPDDPHDASRAQGYSSLGLHEFTDSVARLPHVLERTPGGPATISKDVLMHPLTAKGRRLLEKARSLADLGEHTAAIRFLRDALVKEPSTAPYAKNMLGVEYFENRQFSEAKSSFLEAERLMPQESVNHSNLGYSLALDGDWNTAEQQARKALQLDPANSKAKMLLDLVMSHKARTAEGRP